MASNEIVTKFTAEVADFQKKMTQIQKELDGTGKQTKKTDSAFKTFTKSLNANAGAMIAGYAAARGFIAGFSGAYNTLVSWGKAASDAEEITSKFNTVFRDLGSQASDSARNLAENYGLADTTAKELLSSTGDLLSGFGFTQSEALKLSESVNTLAVDLASFSNFAGGSEGASEALTKALLGEAESVKSLGIVINQNSDRYKELVKFYTEVEGKTEAQAKAYTALTIATEQSQNAIGDYARNSESTVNVTRRHQEAQKALREELGKTVTSVATPFIDFLAKIEKGMAGALSESRKLSDFFEKGIISGESVEDINLLIEQTRVRILGLYKVISNGRKVSDATAKAYAEQLERLDVLTQKKQEIIDKQLEQEEKANQEAAQKKKEEEERIREEEKAAEAEHIDAMLEESKRYWETRQKENELLREALDERTEREEAAELARIERLDAEKEATREHFEALTEYYNNYASRVTDTFAALGERLGESIVEQESMWDATGQIIRDAIAGIIRALGSEAFVEAAKNAAKAFAALANPITAPLAGGYFAAAAKWTGVGTLASVTAGAVTAKFATGSGGAFTVPEGFQNDSFPIGVSSGEQVFVKNITQQMNSGNNMFHIVAKIGEKVIIDTVQEAYDNRKLILVEAV